MVRAHRFDSSAVLVPGQDLRFSWHRVPRRGVIMANPRIGVSYADTVGEVGAYLANASITSLYEKQLNVTIHTTQ
jgi:hypothetical protein